MSLQADWLLKQVMCLSSKTGLWWLDKLSCRRHRQPAWVKLRQTSLHRCNFPYNRLVSSWVCCKLDLKERETINQIKQKPGQGGGSSVCFSISFSNGGESVLWYLFVWVSKPCRRFVFWRLSVQILQQNWWSKNYLKTSWGPYVSTRKIRENPLTFPFWTTPVSCVSYWRSGSDL